MSKPQVKSALATLAHNRQFTRQEWRESGREDSEFDWLARQGFIEKVGRGLYFPTVDGWRWIEESNDEPNEL